MKFLTDEIQNESDAQGFFFNLQQHGVLFDPAVDPANAVNTSGAPLFDAAQVALVHQRIEEAFEVMDDPREYVLSLTEAVTDENRSNGPSA